MLKSGKSTYQGRMCFADVADIRTVELNNPTQLLRDCRACSLDTQNIEDFVAAVRISSLEINPTNTHNG
jgi:hypothetical protein